MFKNLSPSKLVGHKKAQSNLFQPSLFYRPETAAMNSKLEVIWTRKPNWFITWSEDKITVYERQFLMKVSPLYTTMSSSSVAEYQGSVTPTTFLRALDAYPGSEKEVIIAMGFSNGRVRFTNFGTLTRDPSAGRELGPNCTRQCNSVAFNPVECNLLAAGFEKYKPESCVAIWDISQLSYSYETSPGQLSSSASFPKPLWEYGTSEYCQNVAWFHNNSKILAAGMNMKHIRLIDIRDTARTIHSTSTKAAFGVCTNPKEDKYLASYFENQIFIWDIRNIEKPIQVLTQPKQILKIGWCPTKDCLLTCLQRDSAVLSLFDIEHPIVGNEEIEPTVLERVINLHSSQNWTSFCWHPDTDNQIITAAPAEKDIITDYTVYERMTVRWTPGMEVIWSNGKKPLRYINARAIPEIHDVSIKMKDRAKKEYGLVEELYKNAELVQSDEVLSNVWKWLHLSAKLVEDGKMSKATETNICKHPGVLYVLGTELDKNPSETVTISWSELGHPNCGGSMRYYRHEDRNKALLLCSWPIDRDAVLLNNIIGGLEKAGAYTRAAALAVFNLRIQLAIEILSRAPVHYGPSLNIVAMALSGFSDDTNSVWKRFCASSLHTLNDPYLKAMFAFLTSDGYYDCVLNESHIAVDDRVALACIFLSDQKLFDYLKKLSLELCEQGNLDGLLLTGNSSQGLKFLGKYLDGTGDIQSTALIAVRAFSSEINTTLVQNWISNYQHLLNSWKFWFERAHFDLLVVKYRREKPLQQIYVSCAYCGKNISAHLRNLKSQQYSRINISSSNAKLTACPNCRKPLPRCTICLMNMGTSIEDDPEESSGFKSWFTWCQHCRHGGHTRHVTKWFQEHLECAQVGCTCRCFSLDHSSARH